VDYSIMVSSRILVAEDSDAVRKNIHLYLAERDFQVCGEAVDGEDAIEKARELKPDLILLDLAMPRTNGIEAASVLKNMMPNVPIVLFTMYTEAVNKAFGPLSNVDAMVAKADGMGKLVDCVENLLHQSGPKTERPRMVNATAEDPDKVRSEVFKRLFPGHPSKPC
jgi:DNA-binding NarL/FixJ family response regulator